MAKEDVVKNAELAKEVWDGINDEDFIRKCANLKFNKEEFEKLGIMKGDKGFEAHLQAWLINVINDCEN